MSTKLTFDLLEGRKKLIGDTSIHPELSLVDDDYKDGISYKDMLSWFEKEYIEQKTEFIKQYLNLRSNILGALRYGGGNKIIEVENGITKCLFNQETEMNKNLCQIQFLYTLKNKNISIFFKKLDDEIRKIKRYNNKDEIAEDKYGLNEKVVIEDNHLNTSSCLYEFNDYLEKNTPVKSIDEYIETLNDIDNINAIKGKVGDSQSGWLLRDGSFYPCPWTGHIALLKEMNKKHITHFVEENEVEEAGWAKITTGVVYSGENNRFTKKQREFLYDFMIYYKLKELSVDTIKVNITEILDI